MRNLFLFTLLFSVLSCAKKETSEEDVKPYVISEFKRKTNNMYKNPSKDFPPPPRNFSYGSNNFIIDVKGNIYYYQTKFVVDFCGTGMRNDTIPYLDNLNPEDIIQVPSNAIVEFVALNVKRGFRNFTHIASQLDTLNSQNSIELLKNVDKISYRDDNDVYIIRQTTQEEDTVLHYKKENKHYAAEDIKWDKSRIKFRDSRN